jgi:hypothetical protein
LSGHANNAGKYLKQEIEMIGGNIVHENVFISLGEGLSDREKLIKWIKYLPFKIYYKAKRMVKKLFKNFKI